MADNFEMVQKAKPIREKMDETSGSVLEKIFEESVEKASMNLVISESFLNMLFCLFGNIARFPWF